MVNLEPFPEDRFPAYKEHSAKHYAEEKVRAGEWTAEEAPERAEADIDRLLPEGTRTKNHFLYSIRDDRGSEDVGMLWLYLRDAGAGRTVWVYDIEIFDRFRRGGYGKRALEAAENKARELGADKIELHVFGHNAAARALYEGAGYTTTSLVMRKRLDQARTGS